MFISRTFTLVSLLVISSLGYSAPNQAADSRVNFLTKLLNTSTGAKQVLKSDNPEVKALHQQAKDLHAEAKAAFDAGNDKEGSALLDQSAKVMFSAIRLATPKTAGKDKAKRDYLKHKKSVQALNEAYDRVADEKQFAGKQQIDDKVAHFVNIADALSNASKYIQAKTELDKAYQLLKISIESIRGGETLVRSLNFATAEEEYHYELDRNDTHNMLVKLLTDGKKISDYTKGNIDKFTGMAKSLRSDAEQSARNGQYKEAIIILEQSTKEFVRAIRSAGIYIPG